MQTQQDMTQDEIRDLALTIVDHICDTDETLLSPEVREVRDKDGVRCYTEDTFFLQDCITDAITKYINR